MGRRREKRIPMRFAVRVSGVDKDGNPFAQDVETVDISRSGARVRWIGCLRKGQTATVQYGREKAQFKVAWVGADGGPQQGEVGLQCLEKRYIWGTALPTDAVDDFDLSPVTPAGPPAPYSTTMELAAPWSGEERRANPRYACSGTIELTPQGTSVGTRGTVSDISRGGCYVDTLAPFPSGTELQVSLRVSGELIEAEAIVRASHPTVGMGLEFTQLDHQAGERLQKLIARLASTGVLIERAPESAPSPALSLGSLEPSTLLEALVQVLESKGVLTREEILQALERARASSPPS